MADRPDTPRGRDPGAPIKAGPARLVGLALLVITLVWTAAIVAGIVSLVLLVV